MLATMILAFRGLCQMCGSPFFISSSPGSPLRSCTPWLESTRVVVRSFPFHPGAAFLLCSDGLSDVLTSAEIGDIVEEYNGDPAEVAHRLVEAANDHGGTDNVSVVFVVGPDFVGTRSPAFLDARARHATTRARVGRGRLPLSLIRLIWLLIGIMIGMAIWALAGDMILRRH